MSFLKDHIKQWCFIIILVFLSSLCFLHFLKPLFLSDSVVLDTGLRSFDVCMKYPVFWRNFKWCSFFLFICSVSIYFHHLYLFLSSRFSHKETRKVSSSKDFFQNTLNIFVGTNEASEKIYLEESGLFQNVLITGTIGTGKTSCAMYPFTQQLIQYKCHIPQEKLGMLLLDVKGNFHFRIKDFAEECFRSQDLIIIDLSGTTYYNPLDKPDLKPSILANRLKTILTLFSPNTSDSFWLDKVETTLTEVIKYCRLYNAQYVTFTEIHKLITDNKYYKSKIPFLRTLFQQNFLSSSQIFDLVSSLDYLENEFFSLDIRTLSILQSEITRITNLFVSDFQISTIFSPPKNKINFSGFKEVIEQGKIVVLNMNIAQYKNLSKILATYLKLDFQTEVLMRMANISPVSERMVAFICDEYSEYITTTDAEFYSQSREAKCINIVATQSYSSLANTLNNTSATKVIIQNLVNKLWFRTDDIFTIEDVQKQLGKEDKQRTSNTISENAKETNFNYFTHSFHSLNSNLSESVNTYQQSEFIYDTSFFTTKLKTFSCLAFLSNGKNIYPPCQISLTPYFKNRKDYKL